MFSPVVTLVINTRQYIGLELTVGPRPQPYNISPCHCATGPGNTCITCQPRPVGLHTPWLGRNPGAKLGETANSMYVHARFGLAGLPAAIIRSPSQHAWSTESQADAHSTHSIEARLG